MCQFTLTPEIIRLYDESLKSLGYERLCKALDFIIANRRSRDPLPSIREIREIVSPEIDPEAEAIEAAGRIVQAVSSIGPYQPEKAREFIGELGWLVVERDGGWQNVCRVLTDDNVGMLKAQWRQMAKAQFARAKSNALTAPQLPKKESGTEAANILPLDFKKLLPEILTLQNSAHIVSALSFHLTRCSRQARPVSGDIRLTVTFYMKPPVKKVRERPGIKPDLSNLIKALEDAGNGVLWKR